jgi:hypothetical protein
LERIKSVNPTRAQLVELSKLLELELTVVNVDHQTNLLYLAALLAVMGVAILLLVYFNPKQHRYEMQQLKRMGKHLRTARVTKTINFTLQHEYGSGAQHQQDEYSDEEQQQATTAAASTTLRNNDRNK